nr:GAF domain-containing protein [uncultured Desulfobacter sp.]
MDIRVESAIKNIRENDDLPAKSFLNLMLKNVELFMSCPISYFASVENGETKLIMRAWSRHVMGMCATLEKPLKYNLVETGVWGDCVRKRKAIIINDYPSCTVPTKKGYPKGHVNVERHLNIPVFEGAAIVGVLGVGNKATPFGASDVKRMRYFMDAVWPIVKTKCQ